MHQHSLHSTVFACSITKQLPQVSRLSQATLHAIPNLSPILCLYSPYVCPLCQRTSETPLLGFGVAQATLHLDMKMYDESALGMLALMFPNPPRKRHNIHTKMEAFDIASILYLSPSYLISLHYISFMFLSCLSFRAKIAFVFQRKLPVTKAKRPSIRSIWELRQKAKPFEESAVFTCCARSLCC